MNIAFRRHFQSLVQRAAPDFKGKVVFNGKIEETTRSSLQGPGYLLMIFYPLDFTFVCPTELTAYADRINEFEDVGCKLVGISVDSEYSHLTWTRQLRKDGGLQCPDRGFNLPLLSDLSKEISRSYGVLSEASTVALRAQVLIDKKGIVRQYSVNDLGIGRSVDESLRLVQAVKFVDESSGQVCPINWKPGNQTIDTKAPEKYFKK